MYIVGIDIAKRFHEAAIIDSSGNVVVKRIRFANSHSGFLKLMDAVKKLDASAEFGMDLRQAGQTVHVINPLQSDALRNMYLRQTKNDTIDALIVAEVIRFGHYCETQDYRAIRPNFSRIRETFFRFLRQVFRRTSCQLLNARRNVVGRRSNPC